MFNVTRQTCEFVPIKIDTTILFWIACFKVEMAREEWLDNIQRIVIFISILNNDQIWNYLVKGKIHGTGLSL